MTTSTATGPRCDATVLKAVEEHARSETDREVGGVLVGEIDGSAVISASIPALRAVGGSANVTFTHDVWEEALTIVDRDHPGKRIVGWYHSHPDFGVFLSEYDQFIHKNFFSGEGMVALVVDPLRGEGGWFVSVGGDIEELPTFATLSARSTTPDGAPAPGPAGGVRLPQALLYGAVVVVAAFAAGWFLAPDGDTAATSSPAAPDRDVAALEGENDALRAQLEAAENTSAAADPAPTAPSTPWDLRYEVRRGDNIAALARRFYGTADATPAIVAANPHIADPDLIAVGDELILPGALVLDDDGVAALDTPDAP